MRNDVENLVGYDIGPRLQSLARERSQKRKILRDFPQLWALHREWYNVAIKICRAPAIRFLESGICPSVGARSLRVYVVSGLSVRDVAEDGLLGKLTSLRTQRGATYEVGAPDGIALQRMTRSQLYSDDVSCVFIAEESTNNFQITIVKPPLKHKNFISYVRSLSKSEA